MVSTWHGAKNPVNSGRNYRPQLKLLHMFSISSINVSMKKHPFAVMKRMNSPHLRRINLDRKFLFETFSASLPPKKSCGVWVGVVTTPKGLSESYSSSHTYLQLDNGSSPSKALLIWTTEESGNYGRKGGSCNILKKISWNTRFDFQSILISIGWKIRFDVYPQI